MYVAEKTWILKSIYSVYANQNWAYSKNTSICLPKNIFILNLFQELYFESIILNHILFKFLLPIRNENKAYQISFINMFFCIITNNLSLALEPYYQKYQSIIRLSPSAPSWNICIMLSLLEIEGKVNHVKENDHEIFVCLGSSFY